jgi:hypothetical protein
VPGAARLSYGTRHPTGIDNKLVHLVLTQCAAVRLLQIVALRAELGSYRQMVSLSGVSSFAQHE